MIEVECGPGAVDIILLSGVGFALAAITCAIGVYVGLRLLDDA